MFTHPPFVAADGGIFLLKNFRCDIDTPKKFCQIKKQSFHSAPITYPCKLYLFAACFIPAILEEDATQTPLTYKFITPNSIFTVPIIALLYHKNSA